MTQSAVDTSISLVRTKANKFAIYGVLIAVAAIILATVGTDLARDGKVSLDGFIDAQASNFALWILDLMPFVFAYWGQKVSLVIKEDVSELVQNQTDELYQQTLQLERQATHEATHDALTDLPNRMLLRDRLSQAMLVATRSGHSVALLMLDLNRFKEINDALGHEQGDRLLKLVAVRLREVVRTIDTLSRLGGDEFAIVLSELKDEAHLPDVCTKILKSFDTPFQINGMDLEVSASIGISLFPQQGSDFDMLLQKAEIAMYVAKDDKRPYQLYDLNSDKRGTKRLSLLTQMKHAINNNEMELFYQAKVVASDRRPAGAEALIRWHHPEYGLVPPDEFIQLAEQSGLILELTRWILRTGADQAARWYEQGLDLNLSINLSPSSLLEHDFADFMTGLLAKHSLPGDRLTLEITESTLVKDPERAMAILVRLRKLGLQVSIDDFGTGYSSLAYLKNIPATELKIDQAFVKPMLSSESDLAIVKSTIDLAHNFGMKVVAEGVEDELTAARLADLECDLLQGYFFCRPLPLDKFDKWLAAEASAQVASA